VEAPAPASALGEGRVDAGTAGALDEDVVPGVPELSSSWTAVKRASHSARATMCINLFIFWLERDRPTKHVVGEVDHACLNPREAFRVL
jgi:hypothetical protein